MTARPLPEDSRPNAAPCDHKFLGTRHCVKCGWVPSAAAISSRLTPLKLAFPGVVDVPGAGPVDTSSFVASHNGTTPTSYQEPSRQARGLAFLDLARLNITEALDTASAFDRKLLLGAVKVSIEQALELLK